MTKKLELLGMKFRRLTVLRESGFSKHGKVLWDCRCDCGEMVQVKGVNLLRGVSKSCGCLGPEQSATHRMTNTREYWIWSQMVQRCTNQKNKAFKNYGARGITVHNSWLKFENFIKDMGKKPAPQDSIERTDNDKGYSPDNCKWASRTVQNRNTRIRRDNTSGEKGISFHKRIKKFSVTIAIKGKKKHIGYFDDFEEAKKARAESEIKYWDKPACVDMADHVIRFEEKGIEVE